MRKHDGIFGGVVSNQQLASSHIVIFYESNIFVGELKTLFMVYCRFGVKKLTNYSVSLSILLLNWVATKGNWMTDNVLNTDLMVGLGLFITKKIFQCSQVTCLCVSKVFMCVGREIVQSQSGVDPNISRVKCVKFVILLLFFGHMWDCYRLFLDFSI